MATPKLRQRARQCKQCGTGFDYPVGSGRDRIHCTPECRVIYQRSRRLPKEQWSICSTNGCERKVRAPKASKCNPCYSLAIKNRAGTCGVHKCTRPAVRVGHGLCEIHYARIRNTGSYELTPRVEVQTSRGYRMLKRPDHPLTSPSNGWVFEHRLVAYEKYGEGSQSCHWCGTSLEWKDVAVDHLNERKADNSPDNLVVACSPCNQIRGWMVPFIRRMQPHRLSELVDTFIHMRAKHVRDSEIQSEERGFGF